MAAFRWTSDPIFDANREITMARDKAKDGASFTDGYRLGYQRGYSKAWKEYRVTIERTKK